MFIFVEVSVSAHSLAWWVGVGQQSVRAVKGVVISVFYRAKMLKTFKHTAQKVDVAFFWPTVIAPFDPKLIMMSAMPACSFLKVRGVTSAQTFSALRMARSTSDFFRSGV